MDGREEEARLPIPGNVPPTREEGRRRPRGVCGTVADSRPARKVVEVLERGRSDAAVVIMQKQDNGIHGAVAFR